MAYEIEVKFERYWTKSQVDATFAGKLGPAAADTLKSIIKTAFVAGALAGLTTLAANPGNAETMIREILTYADRELAKMREQEAPANAEGLPQTPP